MIWREAWVRPSASRATKRARGAPTRTAGLSMGPIYAIFPSKEALFRAILQTRGGELVALARQVAETEHAQRAALRALGAAYIDYFLAHPDFLRMHLRDGTSWVLGPAGAAQTRVQMWRDVHD